MNKVFWAALFILSVAAVCKLNDPADALTAPIYSDRYESRVDIHVPGLEVRDLFACIYLVKQNNSLTMQDANSSYDFANSCMARKRKQ